MDRFFIADIDPPRVEFDHLMDDAIRDMNRKMIGAFAVPTAFLGGTCSNSVAEASAITAGAIETLIRDLPKLIPSRRPGLRIIYSPYALEATADRLFPESRNRSARIRKKLIKRHGGEFRMKPCMWQVGDTIYAHHSLRPQVEAAFNPSSSDRTRNPVIAGTPFPYW